MIASKKQIEKIVEEEIPGFRCLFMRDLQDNLICQYDRYSKETHIEQLKAILKRLGVECKLERLPF